MAISRLGDYTKQRAAPRPPSVAAASLNTLLNGVQALIGAFDVPCLPALRTEVAQCRALLESGEDSPALEPAITRCLDATSAATAYILEQREAEKREAAALVAAVREAVVSASADGYAFREDVQRSTERFEEIAVRSPVLELQTRLRAEVGNLKSSIAHNLEAARSSDAALATRIQSLELQLQDARQASSLDPLTGVANRGAFDTACQEWLRGGLIRFSVVMVDVDDFKAINDTYGHPEGDRALAAVGQALRAVARAQHDVVARIGGDEFAVLVRDLPLRAAANLFGRIVESIDAQRTAAEPPLPPLTLSAGASESSAGDSVRSLMQRADEALYDAKRRGKSRIVTKLKPLLRDL